MSLQIPVVACSPELQHVHCEHSTASTKSEICFTKGDIFLFAKTALHVAKNQISTQLNCFLQRFNVRSFMILHFSPTEMQQHILLVDKVDNIGVTFQVPRSFWSGLSVVDRIKKLGSRDCFLGPKLPMPYRQASTRRLSDAGEGEHWGTADICNQ